MNFLLNFYNISYKSFIQIIEIQRKTSNITYFYQLHLKSIIFG